MPLSEEQIVRYSRQILLAEVGGQGQERLTSARATVVGSPTAARYLEAGGTPVDFRPVGPASISGAAGQVAIGSAAVVYRRSDGCSRCFEASAPGGHPPSIRAGVLGALAYQRLVLGLAEPLGIAGEGALVRCEDHR